MSEEKAAEGGASHGHCVAHSGIIITAQKVQLVQDYKKYYKKNFYTFFFTCCSLFYFYLFGIKSKCSYT